MAGEARLADLCESIVDCPHSTPVWTDSGVVVLRNQNIRKGRLDLTEPSYTDEAHFAARTRRASPSEGDLVITREAPMGEVCMIPPSLRCCLGQRMVLLRPNRKRAEPRYLLYALQSKSVQHEIGVNEGTGSTVSNLRIPLLESLPIPTRPLSEQRAIAHILGTLDDKIELNRRMNETLEAMARALFKSWFVDFDPVRAKAEGRDSGLPRQLADLFPNRLVDSDLGEIPEGWKLGSVEDDFDLTMGQSPPGETYNEAGRGLPFYQGCTDFGFRFPTRRIYCTAPTRLAKAGDTLVSVRAPVGDINMATEDCAIGRGVAAVRHKTGSRSYSYQFMQSIDAVFARFEAEGTVFGSIGKKDFHAITCVNPPRELVLAYEAFASPLDDRVDVNERESRSLAALRDTLLPKLISGDVRMEDVGRFIGATA
ncbi:MAG: restriction endonuclease subunit S [Burkholderiaceae bacterium]|nr:restriction endonuclease subunit S [Burkholderiaceae bacterium]